MNNQSNQSADAVNQGGKDPVAMALEALKAAQPKIKIYATETHAKIDKAIAALSSIKDQQAQPVDKDKRIAELEVQLVQNDDRYMEMGAKYEGIILALKSKLRIATPVEQAHGSMPEIMEWPERLSENHLTATIHPVTKFMQDEIEDLRVALKRCYAAPQAPASKDVVAKLEELRDAGYSPAWSFVIATVGNMLTPCATETARAQGRDKP